MSKSLDTKNVFIVLEGIDGSGKSTMIPEVCSFMAGLGYDVSGTAEPTTGPLGQHLRNSLRMADGLGEKPSNAGLALLFAADRQFHSDRLEKRLVQNREKPVAVVCDRYLHSSLAYQTDGLPWDYVMKINKYNRIPDIVLYFDCPVKTAVGRIHLRRNDQEFYEKETFLDGVKERYERALEEIIVPHFIRIDAAQPKNRVVIDVRIALVDALNKFNEKQEM